MHRIATWFVTTAALWLLASTAAAATRLPGFFSDGMVLQRDRVVPIWGWDDAGTQVTVTFAGQTVKATAGADGAWRANLAAMPANATGQELTVTGTTTVALKDVLIGEVWVCSGQSNMAWNVGSSVNKKAPEGDVMPGLIAAAQFPLIRQVVIPSALAPAKPATDTAATKWVACTPETVSNFTAVGYFFGRDLHQQLQVPVGLIKTAWGGTMVEAWTRLAVLEGSTRSADFARTTQERDAAWDQAKVDEAYAKQLAAHEAKVAAATAENKPAPRKPQKPAQPSKTPHYPATLYNAMIAPLMPYAIRGAIWYQGESNAGRAWAYQEAFAQMITDWRQQWGQGDFPFGFVQLANFTPAVAQPVEQDWAELREAQTMALKLPATGMAVILDVGEAGDIHPKNKVDVGARLALWALATVYGKQQVYSGPAYKAATFADGKATLAFDHVGDGLMVGTKPGYGPVQPVADGKLARFQIAGEDKVWVWGDAVIAGDKVVVSSPAVPAPVAVRYAWSNNPEGANLYNRNGLPALPFRTDDWPLLTQPKPPAPPAPAPQP